MRPLQWHLKDCWSPMVGDLVDPIPLAGGLQGDTLVAPGGQVVVQGFSSGSSPVPLVVYRLMSVRLGSAPVRSDGFGDLVRGRKPKHMNVLEMKAVSLALAPILPHLPGQSVILMSDNASVVAYLRRRRHGVSGPVSHGLRDHPVD